MNFEETLIEIMVLEEDAIELMRRKSGRFRNCGAKTVDEIMEQLFCYQYSQLKEEKKIKYIRRILELNKSN